ncbi:MAG: hypothetical protein DMF76_08365 [Acidobacteria bacterium]|nr:MAG: hypothetical protein DMF76_08365 [Acidobacteriota bacterium]
MFIETSGPLNFLQPIYGLETAAHYTPTELKVSSVIVGYKHFAATRLQYGRGAIAFGDCYG